MFLAAHLLGSLPKSKTESSSSGKKGNSQPFTKRHEKAPVQIGKGGAIIINLNFPMFAKSIHWDA